MELCRIHVTGICLSGKIGNNHIRQCLNSNDAAERGSTISVHIETKRLDSLSARTTCYLTSAVSAEKTRRVESEK